MDSGKIRVAFKTLGCKVNQYDTSALEQLFLHRGYAVVPFHSQAHIYVINTCTVTLQAAQKSRKLIRQAKRLNPKAQVVAAGCYPQAQPQELAEMAEVDLLVGTKDLEEIPHYLETGVLGNQVSPFTRKEEYQELPVYSHPHRTRAFIKVQEGCGMGCSYCLVPQARGPVRSRDLDSICREAEALLKQGFLELVLVGIHLGAYGDGTDLSLLDVIHGILKQKGYFRLRLSSLEMTECDSELLDLMAREERLCPHLHLPLQSGSSRILAQMGRPYTPEEYREKVFWFQDRIPSLAVTTDIMVGFPGEKEEDFAASCQLAQELGFLQVHVFPYSPRPGTRAAAMKDPVPPSVAKKRLQSLQGLSHRLRQTYEQGFLGETQEVLVEEGRGMVLSGLTKNFLRVFFQGQEHHPGSFLPVSLDRLTDDGIWGTIQKKG